MIHSIQMFWSTYVTSSEGITTLLVILILLMKLYVNREAKPIDYKKMIVSIPGEIIFLVLGFQMSNMINGKSTATGNNEYVAAIVGSLILLIVQYALEKWTDNKLSGNVELKVKISVGIMYIISMCIYINEIYGGL